MISKRTILVTGGAGYIGSHTCLALLAENYEVVVLDNLVNSSQISLQRVELISQKNLTFIKGDINNRNLLLDIFKKYDIEAVMHFAGLKSVGDSVNSPIEYYINNVEGSINLLSCMEESKIYKLIFSSSATVYGLSNVMPVKESAPIGKSTNPYGHTKIVVEQILENLSKSNSNWKIGALRYFNPIGAHQSGLLGESNKSVPSNLLPNISRVAFGSLDHVTVYGSDYPTVDGTGLRDYIHVSDLAFGHIKALSVLDRISGFDVWNLGTGKGYSVLEVIKAFEKVSGKQVSYTFASRRDGDVAECWADPSKANKELSWEAQFDLKTMIEDTWRWQLKNPNGYFERL